MAPIPDERTLAALRRFDTPTVANAIELFDVRPRHEGFMDGRIQACFPKLPPVVGYAATATFRSARQAGTGDAYSNLVEQVRRIVEEVPPPRIVVFEDLDGEPAAASFGEVLASVYKAFGCVGVITSGAARDLDQIERIGFACFASRVIASHGWCRIIEVNVPVTVGGLPVKPGDLLHADRNGVLSVPHEIAAEAALASAKVGDAEGEVLRLVQGGGAPTVDALGAAYARMRDRFEKIPGEVHAEIRRPGWESR
jgi:4-hydroxy-4-methyl-2-oxoglutarate aldolase